LVNLQIYRYFKKYQVEHEKKFPPKGKELEKRWDQFRANQEKVKEAQKAAKEESKASESKESVQKQDPKSDVKEKKELNPALPLVSNSAAS
jgi:hypothetical protein